MMRLRLIGEDDKLFSIPLSSVKCALPSKERGIDERGRGNRHRTPATRACEDRVLGRSPAFLRCAWTRPERRRTRACYRVRRVGQRLVRPLYSRPLLSWQTGEVDARYPVNPTSTNGSRYHSQVFGQDCSSRNAVRRRADFTIRCLPMSSSVRSARRPPPRLGRLAQAWVGERRDADVFQHL